MKKTISIFYSFILIALTACSTPYPIVIDFSNREVVFGEKEIQVSVGNSKDMIIQSLGTPDNIVKLDNGEEYQYFNKRMSSLNKQYANYYLFIDKNNNLLSTKREVIN